MAQQFQLLAKIGPRQDGIIKRHHTANADTLGTWPSSFDKHDVITGTWRPLNLHPSSFDVLVLPPTHQVRSRALPVLLQCSGHQGILRLTSRGLCTSSEPPCEAPTNHEDPSKTLDTCGMGRMTAVPLSRGTN